MKENQDTMAAETYGKVRCQCEDAYDLMDKCDLQLKVLVADRVKTSGSIKQREANEKYMFP